MTVICLVKQNIDFNPMKAYITSEAVILHKI